LAQETLKNLLALGTIIAVASLASASAK